MTEMQVSAIITAYNSEAFVADAIRSILGQTCPVDELVVVDDGSTDRTGKIAKQFANRGVRYLYQANQGPSSARNYGIRETSGELVAFLDADDIWLENKNQIQVEYLEKHPEVAMVSGLAWWWNISESDRKLTGQIPKSRASLQRDILVHNVLNNPSRAILRRDALLDVGLFNPVIRWGQDWELWIRLVARYHIAVLPEPVIVYRWHPDNLSSTGKIERLKSYWNVSKEAIKVSKPLWRRPFLLLRSWSNYSHHRADYAIRKDLPNWQKITYSAGSLFTYPCEEGW